MHLQTRLAARFCAQERPQEGRQERRNLPGGSHRERTRKSRTSSDEDYSRDLPRVEKTEVEREEGEGY